MLNAPLIFHNTVRTTSLQKHDHHLSQKRIIQVYYHSTHDIITGHYWHNLIEYFIKKSGELTISSKCE